MKYITTYKLNTISFLVASALFATEAVAENSGDIHVGHDMSMNHSHHSMQDMQPEKDMTHAHHSMTDGMQEEIDETYQQNHEHTHDDMASEHTMEKTDSLAVLKSQGFYAGHMHEGHDDNPLLSKVMIDQLEVRDTDDGNVGVLEADAWLGYDLNKLWLKTDVEYADSEVHEASIDALYSHAVSPYWDAQVGVRQHIKPERETWGVVALKGLAPYFFETDASLAVNKDGNVHANLTAEYEAMLTQKWVLSPELGVNAYSKANHDVGNGISDASIGLRLRYEIKREFAPYIGVVSNWKLGDTADLVKAAGGSTQDTQAVAGVRIWF